MCKLTIKNIGPIKEIKMDVNKITFLLGPQSSGKSTIAKVLCHCQWIEKRCYNNFEEEQLKQIPKQEEEKNMELQNDEEEEDIVIIYDQNDINKKKKIKISKEKVYLIDGLFSSTNMSTIKSNKKPSQNKDTNKLRNKKNDSSKANKKHNYSYKWENVHDNKVNTFYNSKVNQKKK